MKVGRPDHTEAAPYFFRYIDTVAGDDPVAILHLQNMEGLAGLLHLSEAESLHRYSSDKWSIRDVVNHVSDAERLFSFRAFWFARGFTDPLPSFDEVVASTKAESDRVAWAAHIQEFRSIRLANLSLFEKLPLAAWDRSGIASGHKFTVRGLAFVIAGHYAHHLQVLDQRYLKGRESGRTGVVF